MAYRDYQTTLFSLLRKRIDHKRKIAERNEIRKLFESIREKQKSLNKFYKDFPYCNQCGCRAPKEHSHNGN